MLAFINNSIDSLRRQRNFEWPSPSRRDLWFLLIIVGAVITAVLGIGFRLMQDQLNTLEAGNQMLIEEIKELKKHVKHY